MVIRRGPQQTFVQGWMNSLYQVVNVLENGSKKAYITKIKLNLHWQILSEGS
jgi:hypothetical protein